MKEHQRKGLLERVDRDGATVGATIPERIDVQGEEIDLRAFVFETRSRDAIPPDERDRVERVKRNLRRERLERLERVEAGEVSYEKGERLVESIVGIDRALEALGSLQTPDLEREVEAAEAADRKRWTKFLKQALGEAESSTRRRP